MIRKAVDFALRNRFLVLSAALLLFGWGGISFHQLPVEAYPDVANNYVEIITQWPGISAEQIEQQVHDSTGNRDERYSWNRAPRWPTVVLHQRPVRPQIDLRG